MIGWLQGQQISTWQQGQRHGLVLACGGIGYEVQLPRRAINRLEPDGEGRLTLWVHQVQRKDDSSLFGFRDLCDRELFRNLIAVNGVGPQTAIALLEEASTNELAYAIMHKNIGRLCQIHGVGKRVAERIVTELHDKLASLLNSDISSLSEEKQIVNLSLENHLAVELLDIKQTLKSLGYRDPEINHAIQATSSETDMLGCSDSEVWLRECLRWLSQGQIGCARTEITK